MKYVSTRGQAPVLEFGDVLLAGLATDGGLYVPDEWPIQEPLGFDASYLAVACEPADALIESAATFLFPTWGDGSVIEITAM